MVGYKYIRHILDITYPRPFPFPANLMPTPRMLKKPPPKSNASERSSAVDTPPSDKEDVPQTIAMTPGTAVPECSKGIHEAWVKSHKELPQANRSERTLDRICGLIKISQLAFALSIKC